MIEPYDRVKIKGIGILGQVIDVSSVAGESRYIIEADEKYEGDDCRIFANDETTLFHCASDDIEAI